MSTDYKDYRRYVRDNLYEAMSKKEHPEVFMQFKYGFTIDISEIAIRAAENISEELGVKIPTDLHDVYDVPVPFTLDMTMKFVTKYELADDTNTSTAQIGQKLDLLRKTVTSMLYNGDFNDIIGIHHCITSKENGQVYPVVTVKRIYFDSKYLYADWYVILDQEGIHSYEQ